MNIAVIDKREKAVDRKNTALRQALPPRGQSGTVPTAHQRRPFLIVSSVCTVDLLMPNFCAAARTVVRFSMMY